MQALSRTVFSVDEGVRWLHTELNCLDYHGFARLFGQIYREYNISVSTPFNPETMGKMVVEYLAYMISNHLISNVRTEFSSTSRFRWIMETLYEGYGLKVPETIEISETVTEGDSALIIQIADRIRGFWFFRQVAFGTFMKKYEELKRNGRKEDNGTRNDRNVGTGIRNGRGIGNGKRRTF